jgi:membrane protease subunit HflC
VSKSLAAIIVVVLLASLVLFSTTYTVRYNEIAIRTRFGQTDDQSIVRQAGLHWRLPFFADQVTTIDKRLQLRDSPREQIMTADGLQLVVRAFMLWRVDDAEGSDAPLRFIRAYPAGVSEANQAMLDQFRTAVNAGLSRFTFNELVGPDSKLPEAELAIKNYMASVTAKGIQPVTVGISQLVLPPKTSSAVLSRMEATQKTLSQIERFKGNAQAQAINSRANAMKDKILLFASQRAEEIRAAGNARAGELLKALNEEPDLAMFLAWKDALEQALSDNTTVIIPTIFAPFHLMQLNAITDSNGIPIPAAEMQSGRTPGTSANRPKSPKAADATTPQTAVDGGS